MSTMHFYKAPSLRMFSWLNHRALRTLITPITSADCKAIYGLKQAPRAWYNELKQFLVTFGFLNSTAYSSLFILHSIGVSIYLLVYVDNIIIIGNNQSTVQKFITLLSRRFSLKDLGVLTYFLGIEVLLHPLGLILSQRWYIADLLV